jgi:two-component system alkaline phosphatase synthesis response regulator PhoP
MTDVPTKRILVVEDDPSISLGLKMNLQAEGYEVGVAEDGMAGLQLAESQAWDVIILDVMLPRLNGFEVVRRLRLGGRSTPVLMLSAKNSEHDKVMGLDLGAEDYITKPFGIAELLARIKVALRRSKLPMPQVVRLGDVEIDVRAREVRRSGVRIDLTVTEFELLGVLMAARGEVLAREEIFKRVWGPDHHGTTRTIDNFVAQLRSKLEVDASNPTLLLTVRGIGYRIAL